MKEQERWRLWRGALIGASIASVFAVIVLTAAQGCTDEGILPKPGLCAPVGISAIILAIIVYNIVPTESQTLFAASEFILLTVFGFVVGGLVGCIVNNVKNRHSRSKKLSA